MITHYWRGALKECDSGIAYLVQVDSAGTVALLVDGVEQDSTELDPSTDYGLGVLTSTATGDVTLTFDGATAFSIPTVTAMPSTTMKLGWFSCYGDNSYFQGGRVFKKNGMDVVIAQGDFPYTADGSKPSWADATLNASNDDPLDTDNYHKLYARAFKNPGIKLMRDIPLLYMPDDHEWPGDNWDHTATQAEAQNPVSDGLGHTPSEAEVDAIWDAATSAVTAWMQQNPTNDDSGVAAQKPSGAESGTSVDNYPPLYFRFGNDCVDVFVIDCTSHKSPIADTDNASKTMLGSTQKAWLKAQLSASTKPFKLIMTGKYLFEIDSEGTGDRWDKYTTERAELLDYIRDNSITSVAWLAGDKHYPNVGESLISEGDDWDAICIVACPAGVAISDVDETPGTYTSWMSGYAGSDRDQVVGIADVTMTTATFSLVRVNDNRVLWQKTLAAGSDVFSVPSIKLA